MKNKLTTNNSATDWARIDALADEEIDLIDSPELTPVMFAKAVVRRGTHPTGYLLSPSPWRCWNEIMFFTAHY